MNQNGEGTLRTDENGSYIDYVREDKALSFVIDKDDQMVKEICIMLIVDTDQT